MSNIAKIFDKIMYNRPIVFLNKHNIISDQRYGFVKNIEATDAFDYISNIIYEKLHNSRPITATFLDVAKAFDTVNPLMPRSPRLSFEFRIL